MIRSRNYSPPPQKKHLGKSHDYTLKYWCEFSQYIKNGDWPIDKNLAEKLKTQYVRSTLAARPGYLATAKEALPPVQICTAWLKPQKPTKRKSYQYLSWMLNKLPYTPAESMEDLMPWNLSALSTGLFVWRLSTNYRCSIFNHQVDLHSFQIFLEIFRKDSSFSWASL